MTPLSTFRKIQNEISSLKPKFTTISFFCGKIEDFLPYFQPKIEIVVNFGLKLKISF